MNNIEKIKFYLIGFFNQIYKILNKRISKNVNSIITNIFVSFFTTLFTVLFLILIFIQNKDFILSFVIENNTQEEKSLKEDIIFEPTLDKEIIEEIEDIEDSPLSVVDVVKEASPKVVSVIVSKMVPNSKLVLNFETGKFERKEDGFEEKRIGEGSGFFVSSSGVIVTNRHVVDGEDLIYKIYTNEGVVKNATFLAKDKIYDVALLKIEGSNYPYFELADSDNLSVGESVIAIGNALGEFKNSVSVGVVSGLKRSVIADTKNGETERLEKVIQTDAAINPGNSGGPLIDLYGKVVGINVAVARSSENIGFALPINSMKDIIGSVVKTGKIIRPYIGIRYIPINKEVQESKKLPIDYGILIVKGNTEDEPAIISDSPAYRAGLKEGDIITFVDGKKIDENEDFSFLIREKKIGEILKLSVLRNGEVKTISVFLDKGIE